MKNTTFKTSPTSPTPAFWFVPCAPPPISRDALPQKQLIATGESSLLVEVRHDGTTYRHFVEFDIADGRAGIVEDSWLRAATRDEWRAHLASC